MIFIESCYIENFGKLHKQSFNFTSGLNVIKEENGFGKSTLSYFIEAMFYGIKKDASRLKLTMRKKFKPWNNESWGGNLIYSQNGNRYKITRFFGEKDGLDTFSLVDLQTNLNKNVSGVLGEELFGIDVESFERSVFLPQAEFETKFTDSINAKLNNLLNKPEDLNSLEYALKTITDKKKEIGNTKKSGLLKELDSKIIQTQNDIINSNKAVSLKVELENRIESIKKSILEEEKLLQNLEKEYFNVQSLYETKKRILTYQQSVEKLKLEKQESLNLLNGKIPTDDDVNKYQQKYNLYLKTVSSKEDINNRLIDIEKKIDFLLNKYNNIENSLNQIENVNALAHKCESIKKELLLKPKENDKNPNKNISYSLFFIALISIVLGAVLCTSNLLTGVILLSLGGAILIAGIVFNFIKPKGNNIESERFLQLEEALKNNETIIKNFLIESGEEYVEDYISVISNIKTELMRYQFLQQEFKRQNEIYLEADSNVRSFELEFNSITQKYNLGSQFDNNYIANLIVLAEKITLNDKHIKEYEEEIKNVKLESGVNDDADYLTMLTSKKEEIDLKKSSLNSLNSSKLNDEAQLRLVNQEADDLVLHQEKLEELNERKEKLLKEHKLLSKTEELLSQAGINLKSKYLKPITKGVEKYLKMLTGKESKNISVDVDFNLKIEESGDDKELTYYSQGMKTAYVLALKLSLIDSLFDTNKPFIVLDDPFVNLDDSTLLNLNEMLKNISKTHQIIYLICHQSRAIN